jgi:hypothetical protein
MGIGGCPKDRLNVFEEFPERHRLSFFIVTIYI